MFENIGWGEILVLLIAALFILGPERLPEAAAWLGRSVRKVREFATGAREQLREEMGPEFDEFRKPIQDLQQLRSFDPKRAVTQHLFDGDSDPLGMKDDPVGLNGINRTKPIESNGHKPNGHPAGKSAEASEPESLKQGEKPPVDPDAT